MSYTPPAGNAIAFNFTKEGYYTPVWSGVDYDFDDRPYRAEDPQTMYMPDTWRMNPVNTGPLRPKFKCTFREVFGSGESGASGQAITDVEVNVYDSNNNLMWGSGALNFKDFIDAAHPDRPFPDRYAYDGDEIVVIYGLNLLWPFDPSAVILHRDNSDYHWEMRFYIDDLGVFTTRGRGTFNMFDEQWKPADLTTEGSINPVDVTDVTPEFAATYWANYLPTIYVPRATQYRIWVALDPDFIYEQWDSGWQSFVTPLNPGDITDSISYSGPAIRRDNTHYYWKMQFRIDVEWDAADWDSQESDINEYTMLLEEWHLTDPRVDWLVEPMDLKSYYPKFSATFTDNYSGARAVKVQIQVKYGDDPWSTLKWDSDYISISPVVPGVECQQVQYPDPYPVDDEGFYYDGLLFRYRMRFEISSDGTYYTDWTESLFQMGIAAISAIDPQVDGMAGTPRVLSYTPFFDATYSTDDTRALGAEVYIQVSTHSDLSLPIWDSGWIAFSPDIPNGERTPLEQIPSGLLGRNSRYYWHLKIKNERSISSDWCSIMAFDCIGWVLSEVSHKDVIAIIRADKEYEARVESIDGQVYFWLYNITDSTIILSNYHLNVGTLPRLLYDTDSDTFTLIWAINTKMFKRTWNFSDTPEDASTVAAQLIDCTYYPISINYSRSGWNDYNYAHCPYKATDIIMRNGQSMRYDTAAAVGVLVTWTHAADNVLYDNTMVNRVGKLYDVYVDRITEQYSAPVATVIDGIPECLIPTLGGVEIVTKQQFLYPKNCPNQDLWVGSDYARGTYYPGEALSIISDVEGVESSSQAYRCFDAGYTWNIPIKIVERILDDEDKCTESSSQASYSFDAGYVWNIPIKVVERVLDDEDKCTESSTQAYANFYCATYYGGGYIR